MVLLSTSEEWQQQSSLLLQARPTTTRITTKYNISNLDAPKYQQKLLKRKRDKDGGGGAEGAPLVPRATLTLKTYDPESGVTLKFKTDRAADVGRLIAGLGHVGRYMAAVPVREEGTQDAMREDAPKAVEQASGPAKDSASVALDAKPQKTDNNSAGGGGGSGVGSKKKKKSKK